MKQMLCILLICLTLALVVGCKVAEKVEVVEKAAPAGSTAADVSDVEQSLSEIEGLDEELDLSELDDLEAELEAITW